MTIHRLKTWPTFFEFILRDIKRFEVRRWDREFCLGDMLQLEEWDPETEDYTGRSVYREITYMLPGGQFGIEPGYVVLGLSYTDFEGGVLNEVVGDKRY